MAYVSKETAKSVREALKKEFPTSKFSVRGSGGHALGVTIRKSDLFEPGTTERVNHHWFKESDSFTEDQKQFLDEVEEYFKTKEKRLEQLYQDSTLQKYPDEDKIKQLLINCLEEFYGTISSSEVRLMSSAEVALNEIRQVLEKY